MYKSKNQLIRKTIGRSPLWRGLIIPAGMAVACLALRPEALALCNMMPCAASDNTVFGNGALDSFTGADNTAVGFQALLSNTSGIQNTAVGSLALVNNTEG